jgi:hypothetical protein
MHEISRVFPGSNLASDAPCGSTFVSAPTPTMTPAPTSTARGPLSAPHQVLLIFRWLLLLVLRA